MLTFAKSSKCIDCITPPWPLQLKTFFHVIRPWSADRNAVNLDNFVGCACMPGKCGRIPRRSVRKSEEFRRRLPTEAMSEWALGGEKRGKGVPVPGGNISVWRQMKFAPLFQQRQKERRFLGWSMGRSGLQQHPHPVWGRRLSLDG